MKAGLVLTSINDPVCLDGYYENFKKFGHLDEVEVFMISDKKTPGTAFDRCTNLSIKGLNVRCVGILDQTVFLNILGLKHDMFPMNSDNRRNIGYLMALDVGVDFVISIDDDNYCLQEHDYFENHGLSLRGGPECISMSDKWFNPCDWLSMDASVYQRGFPYFARGGDSAFKREIGNFDVHVNEGLWTRDPDLDAMTWLVNPASSDGCRESLILAKDTWAPVNSQNTAVRAEAIPAYYFLPMTGGMDRYGDIFQGYFLQKCMKHLGGHLRIGTPIVEHRRNSHNYFKDVKLELPCIELLENMLPWLVDECKITGSTYCEAYECLADQLDEFGYDRACREGWGSWSGNMKQWAKACKTIGVNAS
jgi:hypothetical protein